MHVVVTGASSGIGEAVARAYLKVGARVTLVARRRAPLEEIAKQGTAQIMTIDLSQVQTDWLQEAVAGFGPIDVLVNNAGASLVQATAEALWEPAETLMRLNTLTPLKLMHTVLPSMLTRKSGCIVNIASVAALAPGPGFFFYNASKAALAAASESLRMELSGTGVHVLTVYPGPVHTPMAEANFAAVGDSYAPTGNTTTLARLVLRAVAKKRARHLSAFLLHHALVDRLHSLADRETDAAGGRATDGVGAPEPGATMSERRQAQFAGIASLAFVFLVGVVILMAPPFPSSATPAPDVAGYYAAHRFPFLLGNYLAMWSMLPGVVISAYLAKQLKQRERESGFLWLLLLIFGAAQAVTGGVVLILYQAAAAIATNSSQMIAKAVSDLSGIGFAMYFIPLVGFQLTLTAASLKHAIVPRAIGGFGFVAAAAMIFASLGAIYPEREAFAGGGLATWVGFGAFSISSTLVGAWLVWRGGK